MPRNYTPSIEIARKLLMTGQPWLLFVQLDLRVRGPEGQLRQWRLVRDTQHRFAAGLVWQRSGMQLQLPPEDAGASMGEIELTLPNASQIPAAYVLVDRDVLGCPLHVQFAHASSLGQFDPALRWTATVTKVTLSERLCVLTCTTRRGVTKGPRRRFVRSRFPQLRSRGFGG